MAVRKYKPSTPGRRGASVSDFGEVTRRSPEKSLTRPSPKRAGRNAYGRITARHQGGGHKRQYRVIDFRRDKDGVAAKVATIEYARDAARLKQADSTEFDPQTPHRVIYKLRELLGVDEMGGTMRLGAWPCRLEPGSFAHRAYGKLEISERHRHRYEFNREYEKILTAAGLRITGRTPDENYVEIIEAPEHPWFLGCQFHPEFKSKPLEPHPLFAAFIGAAIEHQKRRMRGVAEPQHAPALRAAPRATA